MSEETLVQHAHDALRELAAGGLGEAIDTVGGFRAGTRAHDAATGLPEEMPRRRLARTRLRPRGTPPRLGTACP